MQKIGDPISICILHILVRILPPQVLYITYIHISCFPVSGVTHPSIGTNHVCRSLSTGCIIVPLGRISIAVDTPISVD